MQNPGFTSVGLVWFRYHNAIASRLQKANPDWSDEKLFQKTRRHVVAALQVLENLGHQFKTWKNRVNRTRFVLQYMYMIVLRGCKNAAMQLVHARVHLVFQSVTMYEWLPVFLGEHVPSYTNYSNLVTPSVTVTFEAAAFRIGHSHIAPAIFARFQPEKLNKIRNVPSIIPVSVEIASATSTRASDSAMPTSAPR